MGSSCGTTVHVPVVVCSCYSCSFLPSEEAVLKTSFLSHRGKQLWKSLPVYFDFDGLMPVSYGKYAKSFENSNDYRRMKAHDMNKGKMLWLSIQAPRIGPLEQPELKGFTLQLGFPKTYKAGVGSSQKAQGRQQQWNRHGGLHGGTYDDGDVSGPQNKI
ncbi:hypothetical protein V6N13_014985 [Hibiscus sabdariffa]|uniref:Uncharacterized protein n=1 Tax=Hibiscus sabdariffa TaxID=183260 RepID=A0ABR2RXX5_9ROSI